METNGCRKNLVAKTKVSDDWIQILVLSDLKTDARKDGFSNKCKQGSFLARMHATRKAILTDASN